MTHCVFAAHARRVCLQARRVVVLRSLVFFVVLAACAASFPAAHAQLFVDTDAINKGIGDNQTAIEDLKGLIRQLNDRITTLANQNQNLRAQLQQQQTLATELRTLRGKVEVLENQNLRITASIGGNTEAVQLFSEELASIKEQIGKMSQFVSLPPEGELYDTAFAAYQSSDYTTAIKKFNEIVDFYPSGQFVVNAKYWIGQAHLALSDYQGALDAAQALLTEHPAADREAETMLIAARAHLGLGQLDEAQAQLQAILTRFPTSLAADQSRQLLTQQ